MKTILVVCPTARDKRELSREPFASSYTIVFHAYDATAFENIVPQKLEKLPKQFDPARMIKELGKLIEKHQVDGICASSDYPGSILASILAQKYNLIGSDPRAVLGLQHKYYARKIAQIYVPEAVREFWVLDPANIDNESLEFPYPVFVKAVKSRLSILAYKASSASALRTIVKERQLPPAFYYPFDFFLKNYSNYNIPANYRMVETLLEGKQCTLEGFVCSNQVSIFGIVDSVMFPDNVSFKRFEYPSSLPVEIQGRMAHIAMKLMSRCGYKDGMFNIEFIWNQQTDEIYLIEVNTRMSSSFPPLYQKVDGVNSYEYLLKLVVKEQPKVYKKRGRYPLAAICVLRTYKDKRVVKVPTPEQIENFYSHFPDAEYECFAKEGGLLSENIQDGYSFRYGFVILGAHDKDDLEKKFEKSKKLLPFTFESND